jgi:acid phosphatase
VGELLDRLEKSPQWATMAVIVTYDENGGFWDHVPPPRRDRWGPGTRVPALVISPFARKGFVDHTPYDTTSILGLIEARFGLAPLGEADAKANSLLNAFAF